jgi:ankyrin repeat protein
MTEWMCALNAAERGDMGSVSRALRTHPELINHTGDGNTATGRSTLLTIAARNGNLKLARMLLNGGADVNATDDWDDAPLHHAVRINDERMIGLLLSHKAGIRQRGKDKKTPLMLACEGGHMGRAQTLWQDLTTQDLEHEDKLGMTALHYAAASGHDEVVSFLLRVGAQPNSKNHSDETPLMLAIDKGHVGVVKALLERMNGRGLDGKDKHGNTLMHRGVQARQPELVTLLVSGGALVLSKDKEGRTPLLLAVQLQLKAGRDMMGIVQQLLEHMGKKGMEWKDKAGFTVLHWAAKEGSMELVSRLLACGASPLTKDKEDETPLLLAMNNGHMETAKRLVEHMGRRGLEAMDRRERTALHLAVQSGNVEMVSLLLSEGAKAVTDYGIDGETTLLVAARQGNIGIVKLLLAEHMRGRWLEATDMGGKTALHLIVQAGSLEMTRHLLARGAKALTQDKDGQTPLLLALRLGRADIAEVLVAHMEGLGLEVKDEKSRTALQLAVRGFDLKMVTVLLSAGAKMVTQDKDGETPLMSAVKRAHVGIMDALVKHMAGQGLEAKDRNGMTALHWAAEHNRAAIATLLLSAGASALATTPMGMTPLVLAAIKGHVSIAEALLKHMAGQGSETKDRMGNTALHWAATHNRAEMVTLLVAAGANTVSKTVHGETPLMLAAHKGHLGVVNLLAQHMDERGLQERNASGLTALHYATHAELSDDAVFPVVRALLFAGVPHTGVDRLGVTARDTAQQRGSLRCVELIDVSMCEP